MAEKDDEKAAKRKDGSYFEILNRKRLALFIRTIRRSRNMSKVQLAEKAGYDVSMITAIENASKYPEDSKIKDLANALDISIDQLMGYGRIELTEKGWPSLTESERIALYLIEPMIRNMKDDDIRLLLDILLKICGTKSPAWKQTDFQIRSKREED